MVLNRLQGNRVLRFCLLFATLLGVLSLSFNAFQGLFAHAYMYPVTWIAAALLDGLGIAVRLDDTGLSAGFCDLILGGNVYRVIHECTGVFALLVFSALVLAYPATPHHKIRGMLLGVPAFYLYSAMRLVIIGGVAHVAPGRVEFFHHYMMVLVNLGFLFFLWLYWLDREVYGD